MLHHAPPIIIQSHMEIHSELEHLIIKAKNEFIEIGKMVVPLNPNGTITDDYFEKYTLEKVKLRLVDRLHSILSRQKRPIHHRPTLHGTEKLIALRYFTLGYRRVSEEPLQITLEYRYAGIPQPNAPVYE